MITGIYRLKGNDKTPDVYLYPTQQKGKYVKVDHTTTGQPFALLLTAFDPSNLPGLEPVGLYGDDTAKVWLTQQTMFEHLRIIAGELAAQA